MIFVMIMIMLVLMYLMRDYWRSKYTEAQIAFTQSPSLRNNPKIHSNYLIWAVVVDEYDVHNIYLYGRSPLWVLICVVTLLLWENLRLQMEQWYGFSPLQRFIYVHLQEGHKIEKIQNLWVRQCAVRFAAWLKDLLHWTHLSSGELHLKFLSHSFILTIKNSLLHPWDDC